MAAEPADRRFTVWFSALEFQARVCGVRPGDNLPPGTAAAVCASRVSHDEERWSIEGKLGLKYPVSQYLNGIVSRTRLKHNYTYEAGARPECCSWPFRCQQALLCCSWVWA